MLKQIRFKQDHRTFKKGEEYNFKVNDVNLIVGDQGVGKSTLLSLCTHTGKEYNDIISIITTETSTFYYLDFEKDNPRTKSYLEHGFQIVARFQSHGETNISIFKKIVNEKFDKPIMVIVDEVDMALSIRSCYNLVKMLKKLKNNQHQVIAIVHNPIIIKAFPEVLSLEHKRWMTSREFINSHSPKGKQI